MKKLMLTAAIVCAAVMSYGAAVQWDAGTILDANGDTAGKNQVAGYLFAITADAYTNYSKLDAATLSETLYADYIFRYHPAFAGKVKRYYDRSFHGSIEGGDVLILSRDTIAVGISQRTSPDGIETAARSFFRDPACPVRRVLAFDIPNCRAFMHLDTVFTQVDRDRFTIHPAILGPLTVYELSPGPRDKGGLSIRQIDSDLEHILAGALGVDKVELISCGGDDMIAAAREQWNDGSNTLCVAPGKIVVYERNEITNEILRDKGLTVLEIPSAELSRGRGGPRCMSMPLVRAEP